MLLLLLTMTPPLNDVSWFCSFKCCRASSVACRVSWNSTIKLELGRGVISRSCLMVWSGLDDFKATKAGAISCSLVWCKLFVMSGSKVD